MVDRKSSLMFQILLIFPITSSIKDLGSLQSLTLGAVAQLGERRVRNAKVGSSILLGSTTSILANMHCRVYLHIG